MTNQIDNDPRNSYLETCEWDDGNERRNVMEHPLGEGIEGALGRSYVGDPTLDSGWDVREAA